MFNLLLYTHTLYVFCSSGVQLMYTMSYQWFSTVGIASVFIFGSIISIFTGIHVYITSSYLSIKVLSNIELWPKTLHTKEISQEFRILILFLWFYFTRYQQTWERRSCIFYTGIWSSVLVSTKFCVDTSKMRYRLPKRRGIFMLYIANYWLVL